MYVRGVYFPPHLCPPWFSSHVFLSYLVEWRPVWRMLLTEGSFFVVTHWMERHSLKFVKHLVLKINTALPVFKCRLGWSKFFMFGKPVCLWLPVSFFFSGLLAHFSPVVFSFPCWASAALSRAISMLMMKSTFTTGIWTLGSVLDCIYLAFILSLKHAHFFHIFSRSLIPSTHV